MFASLLYERASAAYEKHVLLLEEDDLEGKTGYRGVEKLPSDCLKDIIDNRGARIYINSNCY